jgi:hypothetical protein
MLAPGTVNVRNKFPVSNDQTRAVLSPAETNVCPSGAKVRSDSEPACPMKERISEPVATFHARITLS